MIFWFLSIEFDQNFEFQRKYFDSDGPTSVYSSEVSAQTVQTELNEIERDLTLRRMLWESQEEWQELLFDWTHTPFVEIVVESVQKNVNKFNQTIFMLEKG